MQWEVDIGEGLVKAKLKAVYYYGKTESPRGLLLGIGNCLNASCKLNLFRQWHLDASGETELEKSYKKELIAYYDLYYARINHHQAPDMSIPRSGLNSRSKHLYSARQRAVIQSEALAYIETDSQIEPPDPDAQATDPTREACPAGIFYEANILKWRKVNAGRFCNLAPMASDILTVEEGSVGVDRALSMARQVIPYRRSRRKSITIQSSMLVKSYDNQELRRELAVSVTGRGGAGFHSSSPPLTRNPGGYFSGNHLPALSGAHSHAFPGRGPICYHLFLTGTRLGYEWGGGLSGDRGREWGKRHHPPGV